MRFAIVALAASSCVHAAWLKWSANREEIWAAQETGHATESKQIGWTPIPTPAPGVRSDGEVVLDLLRRQTSKTDWTNSETCGWFSGVSSSAVMCGDGFTCATNSDHVVACVSGTFSPFYEACLDYTAFQEGSCSNLDAATGCCQQANQPACGTYIWTGAPERFMYKCFETASIVSILDVPQFVVDASLFSKTHTTPTPTPVSSKTASSGSAASSSGGTGGSNTGGSNGGGSGADGAADPNSSSTPGSSSQGSDNTSSNTPVIVGSVIGGIAGLLFLLLLLLFCLRRKTKGKLGLGFTRKKKNKKQDNSSKAYHNTKFTAAAAKGRNSSGSDPITVVPVPIQQQQQQPQHHYHPQTQVQPQFQLQQQPQLNVQQHQYQQPPVPPPQYQAPAGGQQPVSMSYTVNEGTTPAPQPSYSNNTSYTTTSSTSMPSSSGDQSRFLVGGILPIIHNSNEKQRDQQPQVQTQNQPQGQSQSQQQPQPYYQQQQQPQSQFQQYPQQQGMQPQLQPVNHIHVYYAPPAQPSEQGASTTATPSQFSAPTPETQTRSGVMPDALGLFTEHQAPSQAGGASQERGQNQQTERGREPAQGRDDIPAYYSHSRDASGVSSRHGRSPSPDADGDWMAARGPGYRQSF
ncbi:hypothetical protein GGR51DRAFT_119734 [Nemania sp. FL0031]|nr:hypothetical protein GGR51DRAFT_119734 [Nemania sp. FL0031]